MRIVIAAVAVVVVLAYIGLSICLIWSRRTVGGSVGATIGCACGTAVIIPLAYMFASVLCWLVVFIVGLFIADAVITEYWR